MPASLPPPLVEGMTDVLDFMAFGSPSTPEQPTEIVERIQRVVAFVQSMVRPSSFAEEWRLGS